MEGTTQDSGFEGRNQELKGWYCKREPGKRPKFQVIDFSQTWAMEYKKNELKTQVNASEDVSVQCHSRTPEP